MPYWICRLRQKVTSQRMIQLLTAACEQWSHRTTGHSCHVQRLPQAIISDVIYSMWHDKLPSYSVLHRQQQEISDQIHNEDCILWQHTPVILPYQVSRRMHTHLMAAAVPISHQTYSSHMLTIALTITIFTTTDLPWIMNFLFLLPWQWYFWLPCMLAWSVASILGNNWMLP